MLRLEHQPRGSRFSEELFARHLMVEPWPNRKLALVEVHIDQLTSLAQRACEPAQVSHRVGKMMKRVDDENQIARCTRQQWITWQRQNRNHIPGTALLNAIAQNREYPRFHIDGVDEPAFANCPRQAKSEVTGPRTDIARHLPWLKRQCLEHLRGLLPFLPVGRLHLGDVFLEVRRVAVPTVFARMQKAHGNRSRFA